MVRRIAKSLANIEIDMNKIKNILGIILGIILIGSCSSIKKISANKITDENEYRNISESKILKKIYTLERDLSYQIVEYFLYQVEELNYSYMPLTRVKNNEVKFYWETIPYLKGFYFKWKKNSEIRQKFQDKYEPQFRELTVQLSLKNIHQNEYYKKHRELVAKLRMKFPNEYPVIIENFHNSVKKMWLESGKYMLKKYKREKKKINTEWIPNKTIITLRSKESFSDKQKQIRNLKAELKKRKDIYKI